MGRSLALAALIGAAVLCALALVVAFTPVFDERALTGMDLSALQLANRFHQGDRPCLRYDERPTTKFDRVMIGRGGDDEGTIAGQLAEAGIDSHRLGELVYDFYAWKDEYEAKAHPRDEVDERLDYAAQAGPVNRVLVALKRARLRKVLHGYLDRPSPSKPVAPMTEREREVLRPIWQRSPLQFRVDGLIEVMKHMRVKATQRKLLALKDFVEAEGVLDETKLPKELMQDGWGNRVKVSAEGDQVELTSLGADRVLGGTEEDADLVVTARVKAVEGAVAPPGPELAEPVEAPPPATVTLERAELDHALEDMNGLASQARIVPSFVSGKAIGFKVYGIRKGSIYQHAGLSNGDVVTAFDGMPLTSPDKALEVYSRLKGARRATLSLQRQGKPYQVTVELK